MQRYPRFSFATVLDLVEKRGGIERTRERARQFTDRANQMVAEFPGSQWQRGLSALAELITGRDR